MIQHVRCLGPTLAALFCWTLTFVCIPLSFAQPGKDKEALSWDRNIRRLVDRYCTQCHNESKKNGEVNLAQDIDLRLLLEHRDTWQTAFSQIENAEMPPKDAKQPSDEERALLLEFLKVTLQDIDCESKRDPGKPVIRRLNRVEYDLVVHDLIGLDLRLAEGFAPDSSGYGFDHIGEVLSLSPAEVEQYHTAAKTIVAELFRQREIHPKTFEGVFGPMPSSDEESNTTARGAIERFATRAFRRPVDADYVDRLMSIYAKARSKQQDHSEALGHLITAVLISPKFLMRFEKDHPNSDEPYYVDDYELATRLSFFLWSRGPDEILLKLASQGELTKPEILEAQTLRMLEDERSMALVDHFFGQWLSLRDIRTHKPDSKRFPEYDENLRNAIQEETRLFLAEVVRKQGSVTDILDAGYTFLNETLAKHYGIELSEGEPIKGEAMRRVKLEDRRRGGLITSAAMLMLQADPARTNVPRRGNFIAGRILGTPPPPPPPNVPPLEEVASDGKPRSLRELLELHRSKPACANCHAKMDPIGFALENYDAIGRWRSEENGLPIDASGTLAASPLGPERSFSGPIEFKDLLIEHKSAFAKTLIKNLLIYALARGLNRSDECVLREVFKKGEEDNLKFSAIVVEIVKSDPFRMRRNSLD